MRGNITKMGNEVNMVRFIGSLDFKIKNQEPDQTRSKGTKQGQILFRFEFSILLIFFRTNYNPNYFPLPPEYLSSLILSIQTIEKVVETILK